MIIMDFILPKDLQQDWIIINSGLEGNIGKIRVERTDLNSSFKPVDVMFEKRFNTEKEFKEELNKQRGDWNSCVSIGKQTSRRESYRFLPQM